MAPSTRANFQEGDPTGSGSCASLASLILIRVKLVLHLSKLASSITVDSILAPIWPQLRIRMGPLPRQFTLRYPHRGLASGGRDHRLKNTPRTHHATRPNPVLPFLMHEDYLIPRTVQIRKVRQREQVLKHSLRWATFKRTTLRS